MGHGAHPGAALARGSSRSYLRPRSARGRVLGILAVLVGHDGRDVASGRLKSRPRRRRDDFHRCLTRRAPGTRTAGRATSRDGRAVRLRLRAARRTSEANEMRYTPSSKRAASDMECDELAIFTHPKDPRRRHTNRSDTMAPALKFLNTQAQRTLLARIVCPSRRDVWLSVSLSVSLSIGAYLPRARAALHALRSSHCRVYTSPTPPTPPRPATPETISDARRGSRDAARTSAAATSSRVPPSSESVSIASIETFARRSPGMRVPRPRRRRRGASLKEEDLSREVSVGAVVVGPSRRAASLRNASSSSTRSSRRARHEVVRSLRNSKKSTTRCSRGERVCGGRDTSRARDAARRSSA